MLNIEPFELTKEEKIIFEKAKKNLKLTDSEAYQFIDEGRRIDKGEKLFEPTAEQKANIKKATNVGTRAYSFTKRERKADTEKADIIELIKNALEEISSDIEVTNKERQIDFSVDNRKFRVVLSAPRK